MIVWVKETATLPREMLVSALPSVCTSASGAMPLSCGKGREREGAGRGRGRGAGEGVEWEPGVPAVTLLWRAFHPVL